MSPTFSDLDVIVSEYAPPGSMIMLGPAQLQALKAAAMKTVREFVFGDFGKRVTADEWLDAVWRDEYWHRGERRGYWEE